MIDGKDDVMNSVTVRISEVDRLLKLGNKVQVYSPDGWVDVTAYIDKGEWPEYILMTEDYKFCRCSPAHLFESTDGWISAEDAENKLIKYITFDGPQYGVVKKTGKMIPIVDITVDHENHRYYTGGISSHNSGGGKSILTTHVAGACLKAGKNVLYITMEMSEERTAERIDANLMNVDINSIKDMTRDEFRTKMDKISSKSIGRLFIKEYPTGGAHSGHFRGLIEELKTKQNFIPDIIIVDYLGICSSARMRMGGSVNTYSFQKSVAEELRGLGVEYNVPVLTCQQLNRGAYGSSDVDMSNTADSLGVAMSLDYMFALVSTPELEEMDQVLVQVLKNRYGAVDKFILGLKKSRMQFYALEQSAQNSFVPRVPDSVKSKERDVPLFDRSNKNKTLSGDGFKF